MLHKPNRLTLAQQVAKQMEELIESGMWPCGTRIPAEPELMEQLAVSRNTLREAIRALTHAGLLQTRQGDGTYVRSASRLGTALAQRVMKTELLHTLEVRHALEREAAILAARRRTDSDLQTIRDCLEQSMQAVSRQDWQAYGVWDLKYHCAVVAASHNELLIELYSHLAQALQDSIESVLESSCDTPPFIHAHEQLLQAIEQQNEELAEHSVLSYIKLSKNHI